MPTLFFHEALLPSGWAPNVRVTIENGLVARIDTGAAPEPDDERHAVAVPGMPSVHSHAFQRGMAGLAETRGPATDTFWTWREVMYRFALTMSPDDVESVAAQLYVELLETGFTRVGEFHYLHHDRDGRPYADIAEMAARIAAAASGVGIGLTLLPTFYAHANFGGTAPNEGQRRFICSVESFARLVEASTDKLAAVPGANIGVAPHSLRAVTPAELAAVTALLPDAPVHIHAAEQVKEVEDCVAWGRKRPVEWLLDNAGVDGRWCLIHATHMTGDETRRLAATGATAGLCPVTEANLGDGVFPTPEFQAAGGSIGIGTDSNVLIGVADELRQLEYAQRLRRRQRNVLAGSPTSRSTGRALFDASIAGGAKALGQKHAGISVGASADIVSLDTSGPALVGRASDALLDAWIFAARTTPIDSVWVRGAKRVVHGRHVGRDAIQARFRSTIDRLIE